MNVQLNLWRRQLREGLLAMDIALSECQQQQLLDYLALLLKWNKAFNLTAIRDANEMVSRQLLDSLSILPLLRGTRVLDVGTGPGLPGIPLAVARPDCQFTLLDSNGKKTRFVQQSVVTLGLDNVQVVRDRVEGYRPAAGFDTITSRAFAALSKMLQLTRHLLDEQGRLLAMKGTVPGEEIAELAAAGYRVEVVPLRVPESDGQRHALLVEPVPSR
ncbi:16S rRNA (guanine(527)-N(7))-methyltransferase RsmG [Sedimenticola hydrogenitrophicus]|uniref:16S rRNA (guanine(527)-N(7))-methyltransferase RsmG n=1 Tax=Sedimenticola hydrogenitrophicus TaxID=2967975 RepID=UPI0023AF7279|nr:16S rRNA (guanine(527)-N(7))-methyltransferase RsmG [Sedimenticola hydrogenitrophicus]